MLVVDDGLDVEACRALASRVGRLVVAIVHSIVTVDAVSWPVRSWSAVLRQSTIAAASPLLATPPSRPDPE